jgi:hypothetical protein
MDQIRNLIQTRGDEAQACYDHSPAPGAGTRLTVSFTLNPDGSLKQHPEVVSERSDVDDPAVGACVANVIAGILFPRHPRGFETTVTYPFDFR